jgi:hypothetical protein
MTATMYPYIPSVFTMFSQKKNCIYYVCSGAHVISGSAMVCIIIIKNSYKHGECIYL